MYAINGFGTTIYGRAKKQELLGTERTEAEQAGFYPHSYQVIKWVIMLFLPVVPLGTYRVLKVKQDFWTTESPQYNMVKVDWDWAQIVRHYLIAYSWILVPFGIIGLAEVFG